MYDYLIVGSGLYGAVFAREMMDRGKTVCVIDKRDHVAGNCYTHEQDGIHVHKYGPHQFHTKSKRIWDYVQRFAEFNHYRSHIKANYQGAIYSMPPNMNLFNQLWGVTTPEEALKVLNQVRVECDRADNLRDFVLSSVGQEIYDKFYYGYSRKQWNRDPSEIPMAVGRRLPIRLVYNDRWFDDAYEGIPIGGYTKMIENMLDGATIHTNVDYFDNRKDFKTIAKKTLFTGRIDEYFNYDMGELEYRSLRFEEERHEGDYQGNAIVNYTDVEVPWTRIVEHKHFEFQNTKHTIITKEFPQDCDRKDTPYYPVDNEANRKILSEYQRRFAGQENVICGGRLADFKYYDMDATIGAAISKAKVENGEK